MTPSCSEDEVRAAAEIIMREICEAPELVLSPGTRLDEIEQLDSLRLMETVALLEDRFGVAIETGALERLTVFGDVVSIILRGRPYISNTERSGRG